MGLPQLFPVREHEFEAAPGLPEALPPGERVLWQGAPDWRSLAINAFHVRKVAVYFAAILALRATLQFADGLSASDVLVGLLQITPLAIFALACLGFLAWLTSKTALYTITNQRVVMRIGIVLTITFNLPFKSIDSVSLRQISENNADICLAVTRRDHIAYAHLWPHARPWRFTHPEPMLRSVSKGVEVAQLLASAVAEASGGYVRSPSKPELTHPSHEALTAS